MLQLKRIFNAILNYKTSSALTLLSLVVSFFGINILTLYVSYEKSFDRFNVNAQSVYRLETRYYGSYLPAATNTLISDYVPEIEKLTVFLMTNANISTDTLSKANMSFRSTLLYAGSSFFDMFTFPLIIGNPSTALTEPNTIVLSETLSGKIFGASNPVGERVFLDGVAFKVTALMKDFPKNSSFQADCIPSFATDLKDGRLGSKDWSSWNSNIYVKLRKGANQAEVADKIDAISKIAESVKNLKLNYPNQAFWLLRPLVGIHAVPELNYSYSNPVILNVLVLLALILALMGAVNFINFSTAQAPLRAKNLAILQVHGGKRSALMAQIMAESVLLAVIALIISLAIHWLCYSSIESVFGITGLSFDGRYHFIIWFLLFDIGFGVLAGLYPARYITSSPIAESVKGNAHFSGKGKVLRNALLTVQFIFTIGLIASAFIIEKQLNFWRNFDIGFDKEHIVYLNTTSALQNHFQAFADELLKNRAITDYTYSQFIPGNVPMRWGREVEGQQIQVNCWPVDDRFIDFFGIKIAEGHKFGKGSVADLNSFILNKKAVEKFEWKNPLEKKIGGFYGMGSVIGVAENFNFSSLKEDIEPMQFYYTSSLKHMLMLRITPGNYTQLIDYIKDTAQKFDPKNPVDVKFLDDSLNMLYTKEEKMGHLVEFVAMWCILLAISGLLGLIIFVCRDRNREISIRKVNGAKISEVIMMLNIDLVKWVAVSFLIATPIAWYAMHRWLENFAYKTELSWWIFALAGFLALGIALLTVSWQSWKAATRNPVEALRYE